MNKIVFAIANIGLVTLLLIGCKSSFQSREAAQKESETNPTIFEDSFFIKGKLAGRIVSWGNFSDPKHELRQKYLGLLMGNYQTNPGFSEVFPYDSCGNKDGRAFKGSEFYDLKGNLKLVIIEDTVDANLCKGLGQYIILTYKTKGEGYFARPNEFLNSFRKFQTIYDDTYAYTVILKNHEELFNNN